MTPREPHVTAALEGPDGSRLLQLSDGSTAVVAWHGAMRGFYNRGTDVGELLDRRVSVSPGSGLAELVGVPHGNYGVSRRRRAAP